VAIEVRAWKGSQSDDSSRGGEAKQKEASRGNRWRGMKGILVECELKGVGQN